MIVVIPCGGKKADKACKARDLYIGSYHKACQQYALALVGGDAARVFILSAKYGLLTLDRVVEPYDLRMGGEGCVDWKEVYSQAIVLNIVDEEVIALGGRDYTDICRKVWDKCQTPLDGVGGIGKQLAWLKEHLNG